MPKQQTTYDLLISCPSDVSPYVDIVKDCVEKFNRYFGEINNSMLCPKHWSTDSYPQSGDSPQEILNKQFVKNCDAAVAIFWTRFGTPTEKYGSGTEEEIEEMLSSGRQVFMYFLDAPINPSNLNSEQYEKVKVFRERYKDKGIYSVINTESEFKQHFTNHLALHFMPIFTGETNIEKIKQSNLILKCIDNDSLEIAVAKQSDLQNSSFIESKENEILKLFEMLNKDFLDERKPKEEKVKIDSPMYQISKALDTSALFNPHDAEIAQKWRETISDYCNQKGLKLSNEFWNLGELVEKTSFGGMPFGGSQYTYDGSDKEVARYKAIKNLYWKVIEYNEYLQFFKNVDSFKKVSFMITNNGKAFDEDIDIKLYIEKGHLAKYKEIEHPGINTIEDLIEMKFIDAVFEIHPTEKINAYKRATEETFTPYIPSIPILNPSSSDEYKKDKETFLELLEETFCYEKFDDDEKDILVFHIDYLKHNTSMGFPSMLLFNNIPESIDYEISSKYAPNVISGTIRF